MAIDISLKELIQTGAHFGHQSRRWNPKMKPYLHGTREGIHVFDLTKTKTLLQEALKTLEAAAKKGELILLLGTKKQAKQKVAEVGKEAGIYFVTERWLGGTLTNFEQIGKSVTKMADMKEKMEKGEYKILTKKERLLKEREIQRLEKFFGGIAGIKQEPDLLVVVDIKREKSAIREAGMRGIPIIAMVDSNCDPEGITYPIPMNDDATKAIEYVLDLIKEAILLGKSKKGKKASRKKETKKSGK